LFDATAWRGVQDGTVAVRTFPTPQDAALAEWSDLPQARPRVVSVQFEDDDHAVVVTDTDPSHPMWNYCERTSDGWVFTHDHN
jgi:hypothetical protein